MGAQWYDGLITVPGCDKNMPGCLIAMGRVNRPSLMVSYRATPLPFSQRTFDIPTQSAALVDTDRCMAVRYALDARRAAPRSTLCRHSSRMASSWQVRWMSRPGWTLFGTHVQELGHVVECALPSHCDLPCLRLGLHN